MKRMHVNVSVDDLKTSVSFYAALFGAQPTVLKHDYAKWMLDDPRVNFALETHGQAPGVNHLGIQVEDETELAEVRDRFKATRGTVLDEGRTTCCYAESEKAWVTDPAGIVWEGFHTTGTSETFGRAAPPAASGGCCTPDTGCC